MTLQTYEEQEILAHVRRLDREVRFLTALCEEILALVKPPTYTAPAGFSFTAQK